jgi:putative tryptophan/tyrosine transport system substrate-binding protein
MRRREFIAGLGAAALPVVGRAQQGDRVRRIGALLMFNENDPEAKGWLSGFTQKVAELGWTEGQTAQLEIRWAAGNFDRLRMFAKEMVDLRPDVIFAATTPAAAAVHRETRAIPTVFVLVLDPVGEGFVSSIARPGANMTGFINLEPSMASKWLELLTEIAPGIERVALLFNPDTAPFGDSLFLPTFEQAARSFKVEPVAARVRSAADIEEAISALGRGPKAGLVVMPESFMVLNHARIISFANGNNVPAVMDNSAAVKSGGLLCYAADIADEFRRAATYVDRILRGAKPADLPVQLPVKFEMVVNVKTAKALGLAVPPSILLRADEVIE